MPMKPLPKVKEVINFLNLVCYCIKDVNLHSLPELKEQHSTISKVKTENRIKFSPGDIKILSNATRAPASKHIVLTV